MIETEGAGSEPTGEADSGVIKKSMKSTRGGRMLLFI
jgi:hypothetical protein